MKKIIVLSAAPGSGKSTWAKKYQNSHPNTYIISSDDIRFELTGQYQDFSKQNLVWQTFEDRIKEYAKTNEDITVILDAVIDLNPLRKKYYDLAKDYDRKVLVVIKKPLEDILIYNKKRKVEKWVPNEIVKALYDKFEMPSEEIIDLYDEYMYIDKFFN